MSTKLMAISSVRISTREPSSLTSSWPCTYQSSRISLQMSKSTTLYSKSAALNHEVLTHPLDRDSKSLSELQCRIQKLLRNSADPKGTVKLIDTVQRLGITHHFQEEIDSLLEHMYISEWDAGEDLFATALQFRLLRHNGFPVSADVFKKFMHKMRNYKDTWGMLSLYEASHMGTEEEDILVEAMELTREHLLESIPHLNPQVGRDVSGSLTLPRQFRMARLEARNYIDEYSQENNHIIALLDLAKLDYNMLQSLHQRELAHIIRWWKELGLVDKLGFARDRPTECFLWAVGIFPDSHYSSCRIELTKTVCILLVMDDIFDTYGSFHELVHFTEATKRWDLDAMEHLPEYMKICYMALYNTTNEISYRVLKEHGWTVVSHLKKTWIDIFEAYLAEAKWFNSGYIPKFEEYLVNGVTSSGSYMALVHSFFLIGDGLSRESVSTMRPYPRLFSCSGEILRLWDDLGTSSEEQERGGDGACSIQCHMRENNISDERQGREYVRQLIRKLWMELNGLAMSSTALPPSIAKASVNMARTAQVIYQHGDDRSGYSVDDYVQALLFTPFHFQDPS
ncbi:hypothetical protein L6164_018800 [Bauhinia variegata]|uniref:Uncharacterized protein n=1 Tax=Bauhinia variegata TaxID=167791 RepID=A0ACB9NC64_BAUVA|nr:hypothetical protein L6164_018800 [Bauhinia variegata]